MIIGVELKTNWYNFGSQTLQWAPKTILEVSDNSPKSLCFKNLNECHNKVCDMQRLWKLWNEYACCIDFWMH